MTIGNEKRIFKLVHDGEFYGKYKARRPVIAVKKAAKNLFKLLEMNGPLTIEVIDIVTEKLHKYDCLQVETEPIVKEFDGAVIVINSKIIARKICD